MTPAQPPLPTAWNFPFQLLVGSHTSILMSESLVGLIVAATRQNSVSSLYGFAPRPPPCRSPGGVKCPAGTSCAAVTVVSFSASVARLSQEAADADVAGRNARTETADASTAYFIGASRAAASIARPETAWGGCRARRDHAG